MKLFLLHVFALLFSTSIFAETIIHDILPGKFHKGGTVRITVTNQTQDSFDAVVKYQIIPRAFIPIPAEYKSGSFDATLPIEYLDERGYEDLNGQVAVQNGATLKHLGRKNITGYSQTHHVRLVPRSSKWILEAWYHPSLPSTGWAQLMLEFENSFTGKYQVYTKIRK